MISKFIPFLFLALFSSFSSAYASELDKEQPNTAIQGTVVFRIDSRDQKIAVQYSDAIVANQDEAQALTGGEFTVVPQGKVKSELDQDAGASSWYFYYNYAYAYYYRSGYYYNPCFTYNSGYYTYYYYNRYSYWW